MKLINEDTKNIVIVFLLAIIFSFIFIIFYFIFKKIFIDTSSFYITSGIAAFMGAFFAFLFIRLATFLDKISEREKESYNERVFLDRYFNYTQNAINHNIYLMDNFIKALNSGKLFLHDINEVQIRYEALIKLRDLNFINKLFTVLEDLKKLNDDIKTTNNWNNELRTSLIRGHLVLEKYKIEAAGFANAILTLKIFSENLFNNKLPDLIAENRIFLKKNVTILSKTLNFFCKDKKISKKEIKMEKEIILEEAKNNMEKDKEELKRMGLL